MPVVSCAMKPPQHGGFDQIPSSQPRPSVVQVPTADRHRLFGSGPCGGPRTGGMVLEFRFFSGCHGFHGRSLK